VVIEEITPAILSAEKAHDAFEAVMAAHERMVTGIAYRLLGRVEDAQDAAQEVFLRLFKHFDKMDGDPKPWLYRVTVNVCNDHYRRRRPVMEPDEQRPDPSPDPERILTMDERKRLLMEGLQTLPQRERTAVVLREFQGLPTRQVAEILGVEEVTVRSHISVARVKLAKYVKDRK
jgi:RNA polymerase sigma-70 factor (ECF subfamily)